MTMKLSSKSILSPSRNSSNRKPSQISLSSSLSRKLRTNGSIRSGQASPMFPSEGKQKGCAFENPEPSSPKVTCIGQVRVKTRIHGNMRTRSKRRKEASFRKTDQSFQGAGNPNLSGPKSHSFEYQNHQNLQQECLPHRNQRWVHLSLTICEALRGFGAEFNNCFFPCRSSCTSSERDEDKARGGREGSGGGASFAKWLVALQEGEEDRTDTLERSQRRHVLEDIDIHVEKKDEFVGGEEEEEEEEKARVSICVPPKNALLLMRCRSDPVKMEALASRFWESPVQEDEVEGENDEGAVAEDEEVWGYTDIPTRAKENRACEEHLIPDAEVEAEPVVNGSQIGIREIPEAKPGDEGVNGNLLSETLLRVSSPEVQVDLETIEVGGVKPNMLEEVEEKLKEKEKVEDYHLEPRSGASSPAVMPGASAKATEEEEKETTERLWEDEGTATQDRPDPDYLKLPEQEEAPQSKGREKQSKPIRESSSVLPDCLLLMMCEPKLSMEVSRETWVCSTDFIRSLPEESVKKRDGGDEPKRRTSVDSKLPPPPPPPLPLPPRSSCSFPAAAAGVSMVTMIEQKLVGSNACEPFVLTRCKSEPMRSSAILAPEACFWKNRKLEPHHPAAVLGIGAAGVGF